MQPAAKFFALSELESLRAGRSQRYLEFLRIPAMSAGLYVLAGGASDPQSPHQQDELYYVVSGRGRMRTAAEDEAVRAGSIIFVAANVEHKFYDIEEELTVLVFFAPAEKS